MGEINLRSFEGDQVVIHYGGALKSVDAYTFANSLIAFADTVRSVNGVVDPERSIEVRVEALGDGSFRAVIKKTYKGLGGFFSRGAEHMVWAVVAFVIFDKLLATDPKVQLSITENEVVIQHGRDRVIMPRAVYEQGKTLRTNPEVQKELTKTFRVIEQDDAIENFGITPSLSDAEPLVQIPREDFPILTRPDMLSAPEPGRRKREDQVRLVILKAWLKEGDRKWSFEWNGVPVSAPVRDHEFFGKLNRREYKIGVGDALDVLLEYEQTYDEELGLWVNDQNTFEVIKVMSIVPRSDGTIGIFDDE